MKKLLAITLLATTLLAGTANADQDSVRAMQTAKISLIEAIQAAEKDQGGKAYEASIDDDSFKPTYEVNIIKDAKVFDVQVDAVSGHVLGAREDRDD